MFTTPKKAFIKLRAHPYLSPLKLFGLAETPTVTPVSSPGGHSVPPSYSSRLSATPTPRKRCGAYSPLRPRAFRAVGKGYHRVGMRRSTSHRSLRMHRSIRNLAKAKAARDSQFAGLSRAAFDTANQTRTPLTHEDQIFLKELARLGASRTITTSLAEARATVDRAVELAPLINAEREAKAQASLEHDQERRRLAQKQRDAQAFIDASLRFQQEARHKFQREQAARLQAEQEALINAERQAKAQASLERDQERQRIAQEKRDAQAFIDAALRFQQEARDHIQREQAARLQAEQEALINAEREAKARALLERDQERQRLAQEQRDAQAFIDAALRFQQEIRDHLQREQAARFQAEQEARAWFEAAQQAEMAAKHARAQWNSRGFDGIDVSMRDASMRSEMDASMFIDMDASMRTAAPYSPPPSPPPSPSPPPPLTNKDRFALYEHKWAALKSDVPILSFELLPWPTLHDVSAPEDITNERMVEFFYNPERPGYEKKTQKERNRIELLRWHPDKFLGKVLGKVDAAHRAMVEEAVGQVSRFLVGSAAS